MKCDVCNGYGHYPIIDNHGSHRYDIKCPECWGDGQIADELFAAEQAEKAEARRMEIQKWKYEQAMAEKRQAQQTT